MSETLFFRLLDRKVEWVVFDHDARREEEGLSEIALFNSRFDENYPGGVVFVIPGQDVLMTKANVPTKQRRKVVQAVPFVVEEQLASDIEDCVFSIGARNQDGAISVSVIKTELLEDHRNSLADILVNPTKLVSETSLVKASEGLSVLMEEDSTHFKRDDGTGLTASSDISEFLLPRFEGIKKVRLLGSKSQLEKIGITLAEMRANEIEIEEGEIEHLGFTQLCQQYDGKETNIIQGDYKVEERRPKGNNEWRNIFFLVGFGVVVQLALVLGQGLYLGNKSDQSKALAQRLYTDVFPGEGKVRDIRRRWNARLGRVDSGSGAGFLDLLSVSAEKLVAAELNLLNLNYNESRGDLVLQVMAARSESLVQFAEQLEETGLSAEIATIAQEANVVRGSIRIGFRRLP